MSAMPPIMPLTMPEAIENGMIPTMNKMGYMYSIPDDIVQSFIKYAIEKKQKVLDIGCAYGVASVPLAKEQVEVVACDADAVHLALLQESLTKEERKFITPIHGIMPHTIAFEENSFQAILMSLVLHFLKPEEIQQSFKLIHQWLRPGGQFFATMCSPHLGFLATFQEVWSTRKKQNNPWPGVIENFTEYSPERTKKQLPDLFYCMDIDTLRRLAEQTGFEIMKLSYYTIENMPEECKLDGREFLGIVCRKP